MKRFVFLLLACVLLPATLLAQDRSEWFEFYLPWNDSSDSFTNISNTLDPPAGKYGFLEVTPDGHFKFQEADGPVRFAGVVNVASSNFPDKPTARALAARMAKFGINLVRIHLIDVDRSNGLFENSTNNTVELSADRLDKLDYYIHCLKEKGIYFNFCIHAGRIYKLNDGIDAPVENNQSKYVSIFDPVIIELQKDFAEKTLGHVNPYTGLSYADDPAMANLELTNENQMFNGWFGWQTDYLFADTEEGIGPFYAAKLDTLFNAWLVARYSTTETLRNTWSGTGNSTGELVNNNSFESGLEGWSNYIRESDGATATIEIDDTTAVHGEQSARFSINSPGTASWHIQMKTNNMQVKRNTSYKLSFYAKGTENEFGAQVMENETWKWVGNPQFIAGPDWTLYEYYFVAPFDSDKLIIQFDFGLVTGNYWLDSVSVKRFDGQGLDNAESLELSNVKRVPYSQIGKYSDARVADNARFYFDLEGEYISTMMNYLKNELGIKVPVTFTNNYFGLASIYSQSRADYIDMHGYWDHPSFPNGHSEIDFSMRNRPMVKNPAISTLNNMSHSRVDGLPLVLSEYNHPYPQIYQSEAPSLLYAYGSLFDLDGIEWHAYNDFKQNYTQRYQDMFFDIAMHPLIMSQHLLSVPYRQAWIQPADHVVYADYNEEEVFRGTKMYQDEHVINIEGVDYGTGFLSDRFAHRSFQAVSNILEGTFSGEGEQVISSGKGQLTWDGEKGLVRVDNPLWQGATGFFGGETVSCEDITLEGITTTNGKDFGYVHLISMDSLPIHESKHMLLLTGARLENDGFRWNDSKTSPSLLGGTRALCEPISGTLQFNFASRDSFYVFRLDERGKRSDAIFESDSAGRWSIEFGHNTVWYEILNETATAIIPADTTVVDTTATDTTGLNLQKLSMHSFPNPFMQTVSINLSSNHAQDGEIAFMNMLGEAVEAKEISLHGQSNRIFRFDLSDLENGIYYCMYTGTDGVRQTQKLIKISASKVP